MASGKGICLQITPRPKHFLKHKSDNSKEFLKVSVKNHHVEAKQVCVLCTALMPVREDKIEM